MEAVGVGCIWFALRADEEDVIEPLQFIPSSHVANIRRALENLDSVTNLNVAGHEDRIRFWEDEGEKDEDGTTAVFSSLVISFDIIVPLRFQGKYTTSSTGTADGIETFHVKVVHEGSMPVAYVHYTVDGSEEEVHDFSPSTAVVVVRKFLEEKLKDHPIILFQLLGPSPFHADVFIEPSKAPTDDAAEDLTLVGGGYRTFYFRSDATTPSERIDRLVSDHHACIAAFYEVVSLRNHSRSLRAAVTDGALDLLKPVKGRGRWATFQHWRGYRERIDAVFEALLQEKLNRVAQDHFEATIRRDEIIDRSSLFYSAIEKELSEKEQMPDDDIRELLVMLEERRRGYFENASTLASGLVGGLLGAALGAFLTFGLADHGTPKSPVGAAVNSNSNTTSNLGAK
jgi:hypothetical protein